MKLMAHPRHAHQEPRLSRSRLIAETVVFLFVVVVVIAAMSLDYRP